MTQVQRCPTCGAIKCPNCSAPLKTDSRECPYCGVEMIISEDGKDFQKVEKLNCSYCGAKISRHSPLCPSCEKKTWQYCPNLHCNEKFDLALTNCPLCGEEVARGYRRLQDRHEHLFEKPSTKVQDEINKQLVDGERVLVLLTAVEDALILTDSRILHYSGGKSFRYAYSEVTDSSLDKYGNLTISLGGEKPHDILIICPEKKQAQFAEAIELIQAFRDKAKVSS
jgi:hypothetical protein